jgi:hypothetical protein
LSLRRERCGRREEEESRREEKRKGREGRQEEEGGLPGRSPLTMSAPSEMGISSFLVGSPPLRYVSENDLLSKDLSLTFSEHALTNFCFISAKYSSSEALAMLIPCTHATFVRCLLIILTSDFATPNAWKTPCQRSQCHSHMWLERITHLGQNSGNRSIRFAFSRLASNVNIDLLVAYSFDSFNTTRGWSDMASDEKIV